MSSTTAPNTHSHDIPCPDPSVHEKHDRLSAQASTAALYVTQPHKGTDPREPNEDVLGKDGKLSSRSAATSLKYAKATDLPSFPSHGGESNAAGTAAMLAKDYKMKDLWQPEQSMAGSKAAVKAQKDGGKLDLWQYEGSKNGLSAAALAMRKNQQTPLSPNIDRGYTDAGKNNSLLAATKSTKTSRQRADSTPVRPPPRYPDGQNSARNALNAATISHRNSVRATPAKKEEGWNSDANQAARIQNSNMGKDMFGANPLVAPEVEERKREEALRASAVSMAKRMYDVQNRARLENPQDDTSSIGSAGAETAHRRNKSSINQTDLKQEAMKYITLQDQAHKLAQERLAKVDKEMENSKYREYYGYGGKSPRKSRLSVRGRTRNRASSEGAEPGDSSDEEQARAIRRQMSQLNTASTTVSDKQREEDRARLLKAAEKRVHDRMHDMDEKVFMETGKPTQAMMDDWEAKAREKAEKDRAERDKHPGKTHIGGGKYMDQSEIEAIAAARLKPTLDELDESVAKRKEREAEMARKRDAAETKRMEEKMRNDQQKAEFKRIKEQDKATARKEKEERKAAQREEKSRKSEDKRKSREMKRDTAGVVAGGAAAGAVASTSREDEEPADEPTQDTKEKRKSLFGRFTNKFKKDEKPTAQGDRPADAADERTSKDASEGSAPGPATGAIAGSSTGEKEDDSLYDVSARDAEGAREVESRSDYASTRDVQTLIPDRRDDEDNDTSHAGTAAAVVGGTAGAGGLAWATSRSDNENHERDEVSSLSSGSSDRELQRAEKAHSLQPLQSPVIEKRPDLERHISTIGTSSGEESDSDELSDGDDEREVGRSRQGGQAQGTFLSTSRSENPPVVEEPSDALHEGEKGKEQEREHVPIPVLVPPPKETDDAHASATEPPIQSDAGVPTTFEQKTESEPAAPATHAEPAALAPVVATGPSAAAADSKAKAAEKPQEKKEEKEKSGLRGLISRLKGRDKDSKSDGKLHKNRAASEQQQQPAEQGFRGGAKYTQQKDEGSDTITPVTTTSAGKAAEGTAVGASSSGGVGTLDSTDNKPLPLHMGTDGPIGDPEGRVSVAREANASATGSGDRDVSPAGRSTSSFKRHDAALRDPDDVSSSGAEEEDVHRGRAGRFARKLGLGKHKHDEPTTTTNNQNDDGGVVDNPTLTTTSPSASRKTGNGESEEQFEEARDTFDESLAPPAAFAGQPKSQSPVRETKFVERF